MGLYSAVSSSDDKNLNGPLKFTRVLQKHWPIRNLTTKQIRQRNEKLIQLQKDRKHKQCGDATAYSYLNQYSTERQFYAAVREAYKRCYTPPGVLNAKLSTQDEMTWKDILHEQARLLWLKREPDEDVVTDYLDLLWAM